MSTSKTNISRLSVKTGLLILMAVVQVAFIGVSKAEPISEQDELTKTDRMGARKSAVAEAGYVLGEVIVKLKGEQTGDISVSSIPYSTIVARDRAILLRLQTKYGLQDEGPVFKGVHERLKQGGNTKNQITGARSRTGTMEPARRSKNVELSRFYLLRTEEDVQSICARLKNESEVEYAQPNYIYKRCAEPNDPEFPDQYAHQLIQMSDA